MTDALGREVFLALAAVAWASGSLDQDAADAVLKVALDEGVDLDALAELEEAMSEKVVLGSIDRTKLSKEDRVFVYAVARWVADIDGIIRDEEGKLLRELGDKLGVPERQRAVAEAIVRDVAALPDGDRAARYDLSKLRRLIRERFAPKVVVPKVGA